jgi:hypothetical protein
MSQLFYHDCPRSTKAHDAYGDFPKLFLTLCAECTNLPVIFLTEFAGLAFATPLYISANPNDL